MTTKTDEQELLPCPFCGSPADDFNPDGDMEGYNIRCEGKHALFGADESCCPMISFSYRTEDQAIAAWNRRAALQSQDREDAERYRFLKARQDIDDEDLKFAVVVNAHFDLFQSSQELEEAIDHARRIEGDGD